MINQTSKTVLIVLAIMLILAGCEQLRKKKTPPLIPAYERLNDPNFVIPDYASGAIEATGGSRAWAETRKLEFDCVVTFYQPDNSFYLTEHRYEIYPWTNTIRISTQEPFGKFVWQLSGGQFGMLAGDNRKDISPVAGFYRDFAETILTTITAPVHLLDESVELTKVTTPTRIKGRWYYPINQATIVDDRQEGDKSVGPYWPKVIFYQDRDSSLVDTLWFADIEEKKFLLTLGYDYAEVDKKGILAPTKIEMFITDDRESLQTCLAEINFK